MKGEILVVEHVTKRFGKHVALSDISFSVSDFPFGLIGPNGAGKTTLIKILTGLIKRYDGRVSILGFDPKKDEHKIKSKIGVSLEKPIFPDVNAIVFLRFVGELRGLDRKEAEKEAEELLKKVDLLKYKNVSLSAFSAGMLQRFSIAQAVIGFPELVILDEPMSNLDPSGRLMLVKLLKEIEKDVYLFISTHSLIDLQEVASTVAFMKKGKILHIDKIERMFNEYYTVYEVASSAPEVLAEVFSQDDNVLGLNVEGEKVVFRVRSGSDFINVLIDITDRRKIKIYDITRKTVTLYDLYKKYIGEGEGEV